MRIPLTRPEITAEDEAALLTVLRTGWLTHGPANERFEQEFARFVGSRHAVSMNSCASALFATLVAAGIRGEVLVPSFTWCTTANVVVAAGATPVWVDIEPTSFGLDPADAARKITPRTEALICVHYGGQLCEIEALAELAQRHGLLLVEDSAETLGGTYHGRQAGSFGVGCFSFFPTKNLTTGEGGMVTTDDTQLARHIESVARHGVERRDASRPPWYKEAFLPGFNFRMPSFLAALGSSQLARLPSMNDRRRAAAHRMDEVLAGHAELLRPPTEKAGYHHVYQMYVVELAREAWRDPLVTELRRRGVEAAVHFAPPVHRQGYYREHTFPGADSLPVTEAMAERVVTLPIYPEMTLAEAELCAGAALEALGAIAAGRAA